VIILGRVCSGHVRAPSGFPTIRDRVIATKAYAPGRLGEALEDEQLERALHRHGIPIERLLSVRVVTSARLAGRAGRGLARDLSAAAKTLNVDE
jgi:hypothetical protein